MLNLGFEVLGENPTVVENEYELMDTTIVMYSNSTKVQASMIELDRFMVGVKNLQLVKQTLNKFGTSAALEALIGKTTTLESIVSTEGTISDSLKNITKTLLSNVTTWLKSTMSGVDIMKKRCISAKAELSKKEFGDKKYNIIAPAELKFHINFDIDDEFMTKSIDDIRNMDEDEDPQTITTHDMEQGLDMLIKRLTDISTVGARGFEKSFDNLMQRINNEATSKEDLLASKEKAKMLERNFRQLINRIMSSAATYCKIVQSAKSK